jgi:hypothetical protein
MLKAIETKYKGYRFRSRLEARWAVFFDALGITWEYEFEGFHTGIGGYLPDFYMPDGNYYIEIKPHKNLSEREIIKAMYIGIERPLVVLCGTPDIPIIRNEKVVSGPIGIAFNTVVDKGSDAIKKIANPSGYIRFVKYDNDQWAITEIVKRDFLDQICVHVGSNRATAIDGRPWLWHERTDGSFLLWPHPAIELTREETGIPFFGPEGDTGFSLVPMLTTKKVDTHRLRAAASAARSARFEHGEQP